MNQFIGYIKQVIIVLFLVTLVACGNKQGENDIIEDTQHENEDSIKNEKINSQKIFNAIPGRSEVVQIISESKAQYDPAFSNDPNNVNKYLLENTKAINLGIYGSDLSIASMFGQTQEALLHLKCVNILAKKIGVSEAFGEDMTDRLERNKDNKDSVLDIVSQAFVNANQQLKANERPWISALIITGGWVENIYVACKIANATKSESVVKAILKQEESLSNTLQLLLDSKLKDDDSYLITDLKQLQQNYKDAKAKNDNSIDVLKDISINIDKLRLKLIAY